MTVSETAEVSVLKKAMQDYLAEGLVLVVGSGYSVGHGLPSMGRLAEYLIEQVPEGLPTNLIPQWERVAALISSGQGLEAALSSESISDDLLGIVVEHTATCVETAEQAAIQRIMSGEEELYMTKFLRHLAKAQRVTNVITTNYDRLIELSAGMADIGCDSMFTDSTYGLLDKNRSKQAYQVLVPGKKGWERQQQKCIKLYKPHGSLDWYHHEGRIIRTSFKAGLRRHIITPGPTKYLAGYETVYEKHRTEGNNAINSAAGLLCIGYGFNDEHLQQIMCPNFVSAKPIVILAYELTENARKVVRRSPSCIAIEKAPGRAGPSSLIYSTDRPVIEADEDLWSLAGFNIGIIG